MASDAEVRAEERELAAAAVEKFARTAPSGWGHYRPDSPVTAVLRRMDQGLTDLAKAIREGETS